MFLFTTLTLFFSSLPELYLLVYSGLLSRSIHVYTTSLPFHQETPGKTYSKLIPHIMLTRWICLYVFIIMWCILNTFFNFIHLPCLKKRENIIRLCKAKKWIFHPILIFSMSTLFLSGYSGSLLTFVLAHTHINLLI